MWRIIAIASIVGYILLLWLSGLGLRDHTPIIYWQKFSAYFIYLSFLTFVIALIAIWFSSGPKVRGWMWMIFFALGSCSIFGFVNYTSLFVSSFVNHVGIVELTGKVYQLVSVSKFELSDDGQRLVVKLNGETVYNFDGEKIDCKYSDYGYCVNNLP